MARELMNVTPENVLQARAVILAEAQSFARYLRTNLRGDGQLVGLCAGDPISRDARELFNKKILENAVTPGQVYVRRLQDIADELLETARSFGITEQRIAASFRPHIDSANPA